MDFLAALGCGDENVVISYKGPPFSIGRNAATDAIHFLPRDCLFRLFVGVLCRRGLGSFNGFLDFHELMRFEVAPIVLTSGPKGHHVLGQIEFQLVKLQPLGLYVLDAGGGQCFRHAPVIERRSAESLFYID